MQNFSLSSLSLTAIHSHHVVPNTLPKVVDLYPLYPVSVRPAFMTELRSWYIATYKDRFFTDRQPAWFWLLTIMEAGGHVPITFTSIAPLWKAQRMLNSPFFVHGCLLEFWCVDHDWSLVSMLYVLQQNVMEFVISILTEFPALFIQIPFNQQPSSSCYYFTFFPFRP